MLLLDHLISLQKIQELYYYNRYLQLRQLLAYITFHISIFLSNVSFMDYKQWRPRGQYPLASITLHTFGCLLTQVFLQPSILHISWTCRFPHVLQTYNNHIWNTDIFPSSSIRVTLARILRSYLSICPYSFTSSSSSDFHFPE